MKKKEANIIWYDSPNVITSIIIILIVLIIILSQAFAVNNNLSSINILRDIINHNFNYILVLLYFIALKLKFGKKYFNYLNIFLVFLYFIFIATSFLSLFQTISIVSVVTFGIKVIMLLYMVHTLFRDTRYWKDFKLSKSPFNAITNDNYFSLIMVLSAILLAFNLITVKTAPGAVMTILDSCYVILMGRYIYLYREYLALKFIAEINKNEESKKEKQLEKVSGEESSD